MFNFTFYWPSLLVPIVILIPNLLWLLFPPVNRPPIKENVEPPLLTILERIGQFGVAIIPLFYPVALDNIVDRFYLIAMLLLLVIYYAGWIRYFRRSRNYLFLFLPLWFIPIPMAISPILYFILSAGLLKSLPMLLAALILAIGHLPISYREYRRIIKFVFY